MARDARQREQFRHRTVNLSRFLICPSVRCRNLASYALGQVLWRLVSDYSARCGYTPYVVETFIGPDHEGTCFKALGFLYVGLTKGRGRHAVSGANQVLRKQVFVYALQSGWRTRLALECDRS